MHGQCFWGARLGYSADHTAVSPARPTHSAELCLPCLATEYLNLSTVRIWGQIILVSVVVRGTVLCIVGCLATSPPSLHPLNTSITPALTHDNQKCLQTLLNVPWSTEHPWEHCLDHGSPWGFGWIIHSRMGWGPLHEHTPEELCIQSWTDRFPCSGKVTVNCGTQRGF